jgi:hypothetical protein
MAPRPSQTLEGRTILLLQDHGILKRFIAALPKSQPLDRITTHLDT